MNTLPPDYDLDEVASALGMSTRWVRERVKNGAEHQRYGRKIRFTAEQVEKLRAAHTKSPAPASVTTGRKKRAS
ncbi:MAG: hypothetical protein ACXVGA_06765 [Mycobacteriaceae bacterium]